MTPPGAKIIVLLTPVVLFGGSGALADHLHAGVSLWNCLKFIGLPFAAMMAVAWFLLFPSDDASSTAWASGPGVNFHRWTLCWAAVAAIALIGAAVLLVLPGHRLMSLLALAIFTAATGNSMASALRCTSPSGAESP